MWNTHKTLIQKYETRNSNAVSVSLSFQCICADVSLSLLLCKLLQCICFHLEDIYVYLLPGKLSLLVELLRFDTLQDIVQLCICCAYIVHSTHIFCITAHMESSIEKADQCKLLRSSTGSTVCYVTVKREAISPTIARRMPAEKNWGVDFFKYD